MRRPLPPELAVDVGLNGDTTRPMMPASALALCQVGLERPLSKHERLIVYPVMLFLVLAALGVPLPWRAASADDPAKPTKDDATFRKVTCQKLEVLDGRGQAVLVLTQDVDGGRIEINEGGKLDQREAAAIGFEDGGGGYVRVRQKNGKVGFNLVSHEQGAHLSMFGAGGEQRVALGIYSDSDNGFLRVWDTKKSPSDYSSVPSVIRCAGINVVNDEGKTVVFAGFDGSKDGVVSTRDHTGGVRVNLGTDGAGHGSIRTQDRLGNVRLKIGTDRVGHGFVHAFNGSDQKVVALGAFDPSGDGCVIVRGADGKARKDNTCR